ncbi:hypothetical protein GGR42_002222 [Saonia flava]|uniref:Uncharacterized protein n=1 Tax=Saonia flava TaxID=523696 RepID=A0A846QXT6_9FLAO|nr:hypothetical protein [Saonia flava]NJB71760.1 hypothetical protein [Saonia flava]
MKTLFSITLLMFCLYLNPLLAQEEIAASSMELKEFKSTISIPIVDNEQNIHIFSVSKNILIDQEITHIKYNPTTNTIIKKEYPTPSTITLKYITGIEVDSDNNINLYFHNKAKGEFNSIGINNEGKLEYNTFKLPLKKEKVIHYVSHKNNFKMLTVKRNGSVIHVYSFKGNSYEKNSFDFSQDRFYDKETKLTTLDDIISTSSLESISQEMPSQASTYSSRRKFYNLKDKIIITLNHHKNGTRILNLDLNKNVGKTDYIALPRTHFKAEDWTKSNSYIFEGNLYSIITSNKLMVINIKNIETKETIKEFIYKGDEELAFQLSKTLGSVLVVVSTTINSSKTKIKKAKTFFKRFIMSTYSGIGAFKKGNHLILSIGGYVPPSGGGYMTFGGASSSTIAGPNGPITITNGASSFIGNSSGPVSSSGFEKLLVLDSDNYEVIENESENNIYEDVDSFSEKIKGLQLKSLFKYKDYYVFGYFNKKEKTYHLVKFNE